MLKSEEELPEEAMTSFLDAEDFGKFTDGNLHAHARQKADQDGAGQKIGEEAQAKNSGEEQNGGSHERNEAGEFNIPWCVGRERKGSQGCRHHGCGSRIRTDHEMARGAEESKHQYGQEESVEPRDDRRTDNLGIAHNFGYAESCQGDAGHDVWPKSRLVKRQQTLEKKQRGAPSIFRVMRRSHAGSRPPRRGTYWGTNEKALMIAPASTINPGLILY